MSATLVATAKLHILQHSLGVNKYGEGTQYRNHFVAGESDVEECRELVRDGLMTEHRATPLTGGCPCFKVTEWGKAYVREFSLKAPKRKLKIKKEK